MKQGELSEDRAVLLKKREEIAEKCDAYNKAILGCLGIGDHEFFKLTILQRKKYAQLTKDFPDSILSIMSDFCCPGEVLQDSDLAALLNRIKADGSTDLAITKGICAIRKAQYSTFHTIGEILKE